MTKKDLLNALEGLDDDAQVYVYVADDDINMILSTLVSVTDKVTGPDVQNEVMLVMMEGA